MKPASHRQTEPLSSEHIAEVRKELATVLASESFSTSRRCQDFLEHVVELTLAGDRENLTERFLGAKLFGRPVDYETATDSIVRVRANDVRRRLALFYSHRPPGATVRIEMSAGSYTPDFHWLPEPAIPFASESVPPLHPHPDVVNESAARRKRYFRYGSWLAGVGALGIVCALVLLPHLNKAKNFDGFWAPVLDAPGQPLLNLPSTDSFQLTEDPMRSSSPLRDLKPGQTITLTSRDFVAFHDWHVSLPVLQATLSVESALQRKGKNPLVRIGTDMRRDELRGHPIIAIGSFSNPWAEAEVKGLRFTFDRGESDRDPPRIRDSQNPSRSWSLAHTYPEPQYKDYAIITRTFDPVTGLPFVSLAGLHSFGNQIAGEFVSQEQSWDEIARRAPRGWQKMNLQILLQASIVDTTPASPQIVDVYFWK